MDITYNKHGGNTESNEAFAKLTPHLLESRKRAYETLEKLGEATAKEVAIAMGKPFNAVSGRFSELKLLGQVVPTGTRRDGGAVLKIA